MKEFDKFQENRELNTIGYITNSYAYEDGEKAGWKAALEWIYKEAKQLEKQPESPINAYNLIEQELEE